MRSTDRARTRRTRTIVTIVATAALVAPLAAYAGDAFRDVPDSNIFHGDIEWMRDNKVTAGCNPPANDKFCPSDNVTREQMSAFMRRLDSQDVFTTPAEVDARIDDATSGPVDADTLAGGAPTEYTTVVAHRSGTLQTGTNFTGTPGTGAAPLPITGLDLVAPAAGTVTIDFSATFSNGTGSVIIPGIFAATDGSDCDPATVDGGRFALETIPNGELGNMGSTSFLDVAAGPVELELCIYDAGGSSEGTNDTWSITATWLPTSAVDASRGAGD